MSDLLARLIEVGTPAALVAEVARELARAEVAQEAISQRREAEAARTERYRQRGGGNIEPSVRRFVMERDAFACRDCGAEDNLCLDHIIPVSKGGGSEAENLQVLCKPCNSKKKDRIRKRDERRLSENVQGQVRTSASSEDTPALSLPPNENNSNPPTHTHPDNTTRAREADPFPRPEWADPQVWKDWMEVRRAKKARNTPTAYAGFLASIEREATDEWPPGRLLAHAVTESWKSIHRPKDFRNDYPARREPPRRDEIQNPYARAVAARQAARSGDEWGQPGGWSECG